MKAPIDTGPGDACSLIFGSCHLPAQRGRTLGNHAQHCERPLAWRPRHRAPPAGPKTLRTWRAACGASACEPSRVSATRHLPSPVVECHVPLQFRLQMDRPVTSRVWPAAQRVRLQDAVKGPHRAHQRARHAAVEQPQDAAAANLGPESQPQPPGDRPAPSPATSAPPQQHPKQGSISRYAFFTS